MCDIHGEPVSVSVQFTCSLYQHVLRLNELPRGQSINLFSTPTQFTCARYAGVRPKVLPRDVVADIL